MKARVRLLASFVASQPADAARALEGLPRDQAAAILALCDEPTARGLLAHLTPSLAAAMLIELPARDAARAAATLPVEVLASLLRRIGTSPRHAILAALPRSVADPARKLFAALPDTAGAAMDPIVPAVQVAATAKAVRELLQREVTRLYDYLYVVDDRHILVGVVNIAELLEASDGARIRSVMREDVMRVRIEVPLRALAEHVGWRRFDVLPVVDGDGRFLGVVRHRRMRQLASEQQPTKDDDHAMRTLMALGEVYWLGLCGLMQGLATAAASGSPDRPAGGA